MRILLAGKLLKKGKESFWNMSQISHPIYFIYISLRRLLLSTYLTIHNIEINSTTSKRQKIDKGKEKWGWDSRFRDRLPQYERTCYRSSSARADKWINVRNHMHRMVDLTICLGRNSISLSRCSPGLHLQKVWGNSRFHKMPREWHVCHSERMLDFCYMNSNEPLTIVYTLGRIYTTN